MSIWTRLLHNLHFVRFKTFRIWQDLYRIRLSQKRALFRIRFCSFYAWLIHYQREINLNNFRIRNSFRKWRMAFSFQYLVRRKIARRKLQAFSVWKNDWLFLCQQINKKRAAESVDRRRQLLKTVSRWKLSHHWLVCRKQLIYRVDLNVKAQHFSCGTNYGNNQQPKRIQCRIGGLARLRKRSCCSKMR